jgi:hypothetical protein
MIAESGPAVGPFLVYGIGEKATHRRTAKMGISQARMPDERQY